MPNDDLVDSTGVEQAWYGGEIAGQQRGLSCLDVGLVAGHVSEVAVWFGLDHPALDEQVGDAVDAEEAPFRRHLVVVVQREHEDFAGTRISVDGRRHLPPVVRDPYMGRGLHRPGVGDDRAGRDGIRIHDNQDCSRGGPDEGQCRTIGSPCRPAGRFAPTMSPAMNDALDQDRHEQREENDQ